jgi:hypothetical protein
MCAAREQRLVGVPNQKPRVLLGNLDPVLRLGMHRILDDGGVDVIAIEDAPAMVIASAYRLAPDAVVLGADSAAPGELAALVRAAAPGAKVILCGRDEAGIDVMDPREGASRPVTGDVTAALLAELRPEKVARGGK